MRRRQAALGRAWHHQDPSETELARKIAACSRAPCSAAPRFSIGAIPPVSRFFHGRERVVINFFHFLNRGPAVRKCWQFKAERIRLKRLAFCRADGAKLMPKRGTPDEKSLIHDVFTFNRVNFSRQVLAPSANFTIV
jgi:hypothetical protein